MLKKILNFIQEIGTIMYVGGILSHIAISAILVHMDVTATYHAYIYKEMSAYVLILPGMGLKIISDLLLYFQYEVKPNWLKVKLLMITLLSINAFIFLVPMMPELVELAHTSIPNNELRPAFIEKENIEKLVGMSNIIPLIIELIMGSFRPKLFKEKR